MNINIFEESLNEAIQMLNVDISNGNIPSTSKDFELYVRKALGYTLSSHNIQIDFNPHPHIFPDIVIEQFGVEVKFTENDSWRSVGNSIFESTRSSQIESIYLVFGKFGGKPEVRWARYEDCIIHVRTTHVPRFEVEIEPKRETLLSQFGISYKHFSQLSESDKMAYIRKYAKSRLKAGERLWWLEDTEENAHSLPIEAKLYTSLNSSDKRKYRAEAALLCPQVLGSSRAKNKYDDAVLYLLTYHGILCSQARDLFSAGSVALKSDSTRGGNYLLRAIKDIEHEIAEAACYLDNRLFIEYWGEDVKPNMRIKKWLELASRYTIGWNPIEELFLSRSSR